jgi:carbon-monoxide dehydrogenase medium subunit
LIGDRQVRNRGTIGGSLAHADPGADYPTVVKALRATITAVGLSGSRNIPADEFFTGIFTTALEPGELVTSVMLPVAAGAAYVKHKHPASGYAVAAVAAVVSTDGGTCTDARIVVGGVTGGPVDATAAAAALEGASVSENAIATASAKVADALAGAIGDSYASAAYRTHLATVLARRALGAAFERAA